MEHSDKSLVIDALDLMGAGGAPDSDGGSSIVADYNHDEDIGCEIEAAKVVTAAARSSMSIDRLVRTLRLIQKNALLRAEYCRDNRIERFLLNDELQRRGVGPRWRQPEANSFSPGQRCQAKLRYRCDSLILDLLWIREGDIVENRLRVEDYDFGELVDGDVEFDFLLADQFARSQITTAVRIERLQLLPRHLIELSYLRTREVSTRVQRARAEARKVEKTLHNLADRNKKRGDKLRANIPNWVLAAECFCLADENVAAAARLVQSMTGLKVSRTWISDRCDKIREAQAEWERLSDRSAKPST